MRREVWAAVLERGRERPRMRYVAAASHEEAREAFKQHGIDMPANWRGYMRVVERPRGQGYPAPRRR